MDRRWAAVQARGLRSRECEVQVGPDEQLMLWVQVREIWGLAGGGESRRGSGFRVKTAVELLR